MSEDQKVFTPKQMKELTGGSSGSNSQWTPKDVMNVLNSFKQIMEMAKQGQQFVQGQQGSPQQQVNAEAKYQKGLEQGKQQAPKGMVVYSVDEATLSVQQSLTMYLNSLDDKKTVGEIKEEIGDNLKPANLKPYVEQFLKRYAKNG